MSDSLTKLPVRQVPLADLKLDEANARVHGRRNLETIKASLRRFGQRKPIVVAEDLTVIAGNGTVMAMREIEATPKPEAEISSWRPIRFKPWVTVFPGTAEEARAYAIADNRTGELADWQEALLAEQLETLRADDTLLAAAGFDALELDELRAAVAAAERHASSLGTPEFPGQVLQTGLTALRETYGDKATRALVFEMGNELFGWAIDRLSEIRARRELPSNAAALIAALEEVTGATAPAGEVPA